MVKLANILRLTLLLLALPILFLKAFAGIPHVNNTDSNAQHATHTSKTPKITQQLFNGKDLSGFTHVGDGHFVVENGLLRTEGGMGLLWYNKKKFGNAKIKVVYKTKYQDANSGVFVRIGEVPKNVWQGVNCGYELQICDRGEDAFDAYHSTGAVYSLSKALRDAAYKPGQWNTYEIILRGHTITAYLNGILVNQFNTDSKNIPPRHHNFEPDRHYPRPTYGYIGVQNHDHTATHEDSHVYFKEISVTPL